MLLITKVSVEVVKIAERLRAHVRQIDIATLLKAEARDRLQFAITRSSRVLQEKQAFSRRELISDGLEHEVTTRAALFVTEPQQQVIVELVVHLQVPRDAVGIFQVVRRSVAEDACTIDDHT